MTETIAQQRPQTASLEGYRVVNNTKEDPIGIEAGKQVTEDLALGLPEFNVRQYFGSQPTIFVDYDYVVTAYAEGSGRAIGLLGARWLGQGDCRFLYLWTAMIADAYRNSLLFNRMLKSFFLHVTAGDENGLPSMIVTKTYNPVVYGIFKSFSQAVSGLQIYPQIPDVGQTLEMRSVAEKVAHGISPLLQLDPETGVIRGGQAMVAPDFFPRMEMSSDSDVNAHFQSHLTRADQILCILRMSPDIKAHAYAAIKGRRQTLSKPAKDTLRSGNGHEAH
jgi:hypothetical protein